MKVQTYEQRILIADEGKTLCNHKEKMISPDGKTFLAINGKEEDWTEISWEEAEALQKQWEAEAEI